MARSIHKITGFAAILCLTPLIAGATELALKRVLLSTGGVGYFEHVARVTGDATLKLEVKLDQVDDILKSLVVYDAGGAVSAVRLPGRAPMEQVFRDLPFDERALNSPVDLLNALKGVEVEVVGTRTVKGRIVAVMPETVTLFEEGESVLRHRVSVLADDGIHQFVLEQTDAVRFVDPNLQAQINQALAETAKHRIMDRRTLEIDVKGHGQRTVYIGYVTGTPLWKAAYRLTVPEVGAKAHLQGWAVLENMSGHDWRDVSLTLASGNPVTFRQALYESYYVDRPEVPVEVLGRILPGADTGALDIPERVRKPSASMAYEVAPPTKRMAGRAMPMMTSAPPMPPPAPPANPAEAQEAATQVLFRLPIPVSVKAGHSLVVPIIDRAVPATRMDLYQAGTHKTHPLAAVRLSNDGDTGLPPGVLTVYERNVAQSISFVGDARLATLPVGEERFVSFALDQRVNVDVTHADSETFAKAAISRGVLRIETMQRRVSDYRLQGPKGSQRTVVVEHPRRRGWTLAEPKKDAVKVTPNAYRITGTLDASGKGARRIVLTRTRINTYGLANLTANSFMVWARDGRLPKAMRDAAARAADLRGEVEIAERALKRVKSEAASIAKDQARLRDNIASVPEGSDLHARYLKKLSAEEDRLEALEAERATTQTRLHKATARLADYIATLKF